jgi:putative Mg2+ transporter-C (MgtC) family protein
MFGGAMTAAVSWQDILLRLGAALLAGVLIGLDRGMRGRIAGLRTTILICLAATGAMIEANLVLSVLGKTSSTFAVMDTLRFPLGILSGIGFIGAGAIVRRGNLVTGVTTAATLWLVTVVGLILGAGYILFGLGLAVLAFAVLALLKQVEPRLYRQHRSHLTVTSIGNGASNNEVCAMVRKAGFTISSLALSYDGGRRLDMHLEWYSSDKQDHTPPLVEQLAGREGLTGIRWEPISAGHLFE